MQAPQAPRKVVNKAGAGDAFNAGMIYGLHEGWDLEKSMRFGTAMATICLEGRSCTDSMANMIETLDFMRTQPYEHL
jgi:sugar/nucleoside kinase (ribokinase family)